VYGRLADVRAIVYVRASLDRTGEELAVNRQSEDGHDLAGRRGWTVAAEHRDNDLSASGKRKRPGFEAVLADIAAGRAEAVIAWDWTRLSRNARDTLRLLELGQKHGTTVALVRGSDIELGTPAGRLTANVLASVALHEIEVKADRQRRANQQAAADGRRVGGRRAFGYELDGIRQRPVEADALRGAYDKVLAGISLGAIARAMREAGLTTPQTRRGKHSGEAGRWTAQALRATLLNPRYAGLRSYLGADALAEGGNRAAARLKAPYVPAQWEGIVTEDVWRAAVERITDPSRRRESHNARGLLTGVAQCGLCNDGTTVHTGGAATTQNYRVYRCRAYAHLSRAAAPVDEWVSAVVIERLARPDAADLLAPAVDRPDAAELQRQATAYRQRLGSLARLLADGTLDEAAVRSESTRLRESLTAVEAQLTDSGRVDLLGPLVNADDVEAEWDRYDTDRKRAVIDLLMTVRLLPPGRGTRRFRTETVEVTPK
jgi:site-specific DNA recombinase